jgi:uncharacterized protein YjlB
LGRRFATVLAAVGFGPAAKVLALSKLQPEAIYLSRNGWVPNNERLPVLFYRGAIAPVPRRRVATFEDRFLRNGWPAQSRNSIYDFHHYHSTAHEVMGFAAGEARLMLGGEGGHEVAVRAGDVLVLPAGTGHCMLQASPDFLVIGAYPPNTEWDICKTAPTATVMERIRHLELPILDPVSGARGSLPHMWSKPRSVAKAS